MGASARTIGTSSKDVPHQCLGAGLRGERSVVEKLAQAWRMRRLRPLAPLLTLSARQRARSFEVQRHRARVSLRAKAVRDRALQISDGDLSEQRYQVRIEQDSRAALCSTNECWHCVLCGKGYPIAGCASRAPWLGRGERHMASAPRP